MSSKALRYERIITAEHVCLLPQFTVLIFDPYDDCYDTAERSWCDVQSGLVLECSHFTERGREWVVGLERMTQREEVL